MIKVTKDFNDIPNILTISPTRGKSREIVFNLNIVNSEYCDEKNSYKVKSIQKKLNTIYNLKCAYCEQKLLDAPKHIEHYRPKNHYYWLAYSWDNLLLSCGSCNSVKDDNFKTLNNKVNYSNEKYSNIHNLSDDYDKLEIPQIINPEKDDIIKDIVYNKNGYVNSPNQRVQHTIEIACKLNRDELLQKRQIFINDFIHKLNTHYLYFLKYGDITRFIPEIKTFLEQCNKEGEFYSLKYFMKNNFYIFIDYKNLAIIINKLYKKILGNN